jgi:predicted hydrocarbon binding protein
MAKNSIIDQLEYDPSSGALTYKGVRYILIRPETIAGFQHALEKISLKDTRQAFFMGGFDGGLLSATKYKEMYDFSDAQIIEFMMQMGTEIGWGKFRLNHYRPDEKLLQVTVEKSAFSEIYGKSSDGVCDLIRGVLSGMASALFSKDCEATEISCLARGDKNCVFVVTSE